MRIVEENSKKGTGIKRWLVLGFFLLIFVFSRLIPGIPPPITLAAEPLTPPLFNILGQPFYITNSLLTLFLIDILIIVSVLVARRGFGDETKPARGLANFFEMLVEAIYNLAESTAGGKWARSFFPWVATIIILVLLANLTRLFPGFETIGELKVAHENGYPAKQIVPGIYVLYKAPSSLASTIQAETQPQFEIIPFFRGPSTDLNFTLSLALVTMFMVQVFGVRANGGRYFSKFFNFGPFIRIWTTKKLGVFEILMPFIDIFVGILELISEIAKIISFSFRLLGSIFGGSVLVAIIGLLLPAAVFALYFLEMFIGTIQALVFGVLALLFMTLAIQPPHGGEEHT